MATRIQLRRDTEANWILHDPVLAEGELALNLDNGQIKIGNGVDAWSAIAYNPFALNLDDLANVSLSSVSNGDFLRYSGSASAWVNDPVNLSTDTVGDYVQSLVAGTGITLTNNSGEGSNPTIAIGQAVETSSSVSFGHVSSDVTGDVTGDLFGNADTATSLETARTIALSGDISGSVSFNGSSDVTIATTVQPNSVALGTDTTGNYMSDVVAGTGVSISHTAGEGSSASISIGQSVGISDNPSFAGATLDVVQVGITSSGEIDTISGNLTIDSAGGTVTIDDDLVVSGNLTVNGTTTSINTETITLDDNIIVLNNNATGTPTQNAGIQVERGSSNNVELRWNESTDSWEITEDGTTYRNIAAGQDVETSSSVTFAAVTAPVIGNASTASALQNARGISLAGDLSGSVSFDGSTDVTITATVEPNSVALGTDTTGNYLVDVVGQNGVTITHTPDEGSTASISLVQDINTSSSVTFAHVSADLTGDVTGNSSTASTLQTARSIALSGDLSGSVSFDGSSDVTISATIEPNSVALGTDTTGNYVADVVAGAAITVTHTPAEGSSASIALNASLNDLNDVVVSAPAEFQALAYDGIGWVPTYTPVVSYVRNAESTTLTAGTAVYLFGGTGDHASVKRADNTSDVTSSKTIGLIGSPIAASQNGPVITRGYVDGINLSAYSVGDILWLGSNGALTTAKPQAPLHMVFIGVVVRATNNGIVYVAVQNGYELNELHDVKTNGKTDKDVLMWNSASAIWVNEQINLGTDTVGDYVQNLVAGTGVTLTNNSGESATPTVAIGQDVSTTASVFFYNLETTHDLTVGGNLIVSGSVVTENQTSLEIDDPFIYLNGSSSVTNVDLGIAGNYNDGTYRHAGIFRDATDGKFKFFDSYEPEPSNPIDTGHASYSPAPVVAETFESTVTTGTAPFVVSSTTEVANLHADTASSLHTARAINLSGDLSGSVLFDGSGDVTLTATVEPNSVALGTDTTGNYLLDLSEGTGVTIIHTPGEGSTASISIGQNVATTASVTFSHVSADVTGDVLGNLTGDVTGNADTASTLETARTISLSGDLSGSASFDGSSDITITATVEPNSIVLGTDTTGNYISDLVSGSGVTINHTPGEGSSASVSLNASLDDLSNVSASAPTDGQFLKYVSASSLWVPENIPSINTLDDIGDVTITSASAGHILQWNGSAWVNQFPEASVTISETAPLSPSEGDLWFDSLTLDIFVRYDGAWLQINTENQIESLDDLFDVSVQDAEPNQFLKYDGTDWIPASSVLPTQISSKVSNYSLTASDVNKLIEMNVGSANTVTVPTNSSQPMDIGSRIEIVQYGAGKTQVVGAAGVTIRSHNGSYISGQYGYVTLVKRSNNEWILFGDLSSS